MDAWAASNLNARSLSLSSRRADGLDFLASLRPFDANTPLSPDLESLGPLSRPRLRSVATELPVFGEPVVLEDEPLFDKGFPPLAVTPAILAPPPVFITLEVVDFKPPADSIIFAGNNFCGVCSVCGFFDAGPEFTPGLRPVWVFGEPLLPATTLPDVDRDDEEAMDDDEVPDDEVAAAIVPDDDDDDDDSF